MENTTSPETPIDPDKNPDLNRREFITGIGRAGNFTYQIRKRAALRERKRRVIHHRSSGDEQRYPNRIGNFSKTLPHDMTTGRLTRTPTMPCSMRMKAWFDEDAELPFDPVEPTPDGQAQSPHIFTLNYK